MSFTRGLIGLVVALLCSSAAWAGPLLTVDQQNVGAPYQGFVVPGDAAVGQTFTPTLSSLNAVELHMNSQTGLVGDAFVRIRDGGITGTVLGTSGFQALSGPALPTTLVHFDFAAPVALTPGSLYAIEVVQNSGAKLGVFLTPGFGANPYAGGTAYFLGAARTGDDLWFKEGLHTAAPVPEPSAILLVAAGLGLLAMRRRRRA